MQSEDAVQLKCQDCEQEQAEVQTQLTIGQPGDKYEQEADNMASQVMSMPDPTAQNVQRQEMGEEETLQQKPLADAITPVVQRQTSETPQQDSAGQNLESQLAAEKGGGSPLSDEVQAFMEPRFGADFSEVRVHTGNAAVQMNQQLGAQAFTHGNDIYYGKGKAPGNDALTAHELTHTIQQTGIVQRQEASDGKAKPSKKIKDSLKELSKASVESKRKEEGKEEGKKLIEYIRQQLKEYPAKIKSYKQQSDPKTEEKLKVLGKIAAEAARIEFLLGTIYIGGSSQTHKWEEKSNQGYLVDYYRKEANSAKAAAWCSMFATTVQKTVWGSKTVQSGYKVAKKFDYDSKKGGKFVGTKSATQPDKNPWNSLKESLSKTNNNQKRQTLVDTFFKNNFMPQAGDIMVVRRADKAKENSFTSSKKSHTTLIEKVKDRKIYTIEGNKEDRVTGRTFDLTNPEHVKEIIFVSRQNLSGEASKSGKESDKSGTSNANLSEEDLLKPIRCISKLLKDHAEEKSYINKLADDKTDAVANLVKHSVSVSGSKDH